MDNIFSFLNNQEMKMLEEELQVSFCEVQRKLHLQMPERRFMSRPVIFIIW